MALSRKQIAAEVDEVRDAINAALHHAVTVSVDGMQEIEPCQNACTHRIAKEWTALGIANVMSRVHSDNLVHRDD